MRGTLKCGHFSCTTLTTFTIPLFMTVARWRKALARSVGEAAASYFTAVSASIGLARPQKSVEDAGGCERANDEIRTQIQLSLSDRMNVDSRSTTDLPHRIYCRLFHTHTRAPDRLTMRE